MNVYYFQAFMVSNKLGKNDVHITTNTYKQISNSYYPNILEINKEKV